MHIIRDATNHQADRRTARPPTNTRLRRLPRAAAGQIATAEGERGTRQWHRHRWRVRLMHAWRARLVIDTGLGHGFCSDNTGLKSASSGQRWCVHLHPQLRLLPPAVGGPPAVQSTAEPVRRARPGPPPLPPVAFARHAPFAPADRSFVGHRCRRSSSLRVRSGPATARAEAEPRSGDDLRAARPAAVAAPIVPAARGGRQRVQRVQLGSHSLRSGVGPSGCARPIVLRDSRSVCARSPGGRARSFCLCPFPPAACPPLSCL